MSSSEFRHCTRFHFFDEPLAVDSDEAVIRVGVGGNAVFCLIHIEAFEVQVRLVTFDGVFDPKGWRICHPLVLGLEWPSGFPVAPYLLLSFVSLPAGT
jgi:hypothetical protein